MFVSYSIKLTKFIKFTKKLTNPKVKPDLTKRPI